MKLSASIALAATLSIAAAEPHHHQHRHAHQVKRDVTVTDNVPGPTVTVFELGNQTIDLAEVCSGLADGDLQWGSVTPTTNVCASPTGWSQWSGWTSSTPCSSTTTTTTPAASPAAQSPSTSESPPPSNPTWSSIPEASGLGAPFPDGQLDCSEFPSGYGALYIEYLGFLGWIGLQLPTYSGDVVSNIVTGVSGQTCSEGMMCSYACPPGYQKSQWPSTQGGAGQSVGGISCSGGKLHLTNPGLSTSLCIPGTGGVQATNNAGDVVSICRTDYPGTEGETVPLQIPAGGTSPITCPSADTYYKWENQSTSAQYYLNPIGVQQSEACQWNSASGNTGNAAPINLGVGEADGKIWLSIAQNKPTTYEQYQGKVEIQGQLSDDCYYENGQYCQNGNCNGDGCTVRFFLVTLSFDQAAKLNSIGGGPIGHCDLRHLSGVKAWIYDTHLTLAYINHGIYSAVLRFL